MTARYLGTRVLSCPTPMNYPTRPPLLGAYVNPGINDPVVKVKVRNPATLHVNQWDF